MSQPSTYSQHDQPGTTGDTVADMQTRPDRGRPGLLELGVGVAVWSVTVFAFIPQLRRLDLEPAVLGLILTAMSGVIDITAFAVTGVLRVRTLAGFGVRRVRARWLLIAAGAGILTLIVKSLASAAWILVSGDTSNPQSEYAQGAAGGVAFLVMATLFLGVLTPVGEELLFRGVVATVLLRYGAVVGVGGSALIFALFHGINSVFPAALIIGLVTAELYRRTGSIWPSVVVHVVVNLPAPLVSVLAGLG